MKLNKSKAVKSNLKIICLYVGLMLVWSVFGRPITEFVSPRFPARGSYCCSSHVIEYGPTDIYDDKFGFGLIYSRDVGENQAIENKPIMELEKLGYEKTIQTGGMQLYLTWLSIVIIGIYNMFAIWRNKENQFKHKLIRTVLCVIILSLMFYVLTLMAVFWY